MIWTPILLSLRPNLEILDEPPASRPQTPTHIPSPFRQIRISKKSHIFLWLFTVFRIFENFKWYRKSIWFPASCPPARFRSDPSLHHREYFLEGQKLLKNRKHILWRPLARELARISIIALGYFLARHQEITSRNVWDILAAQRKR